MATGRRRVPVRYHPHMSVSLEGLLSDFRLPDILTFLNLGRRSGRLDVVCGLVEASIYIADGEVVFADSDDPELTMAALALRQTGLTREQRTRIAALSTAGVREFLEGVRSQDVVDDQLLVDLQKRRVAEVVYHGYAWSSGSFLFDSGHPVPEGAVTIDVALCNLIMEGARRIDEWQECRALFPDEHLIFRAARNPQVQGEISLSKEEWSLLLRLDGKLTLHDLAAEEGADPLTIYRTLYGLAANQLVEVVPPEDVDTRILETENAVDTVERRKTRASDLALVLAPDATITFEDVLAQRISILRDVTRGSVFTLVDEEYTIGRKPEAEIRVTDELVSSLHAMLLRDGDGYRIEDRESKNGTFVNGQRIRNQLLRHGDSIRVGATEFRYSSESQFGRGVLPETSA